MKRWQKVLLGALTLAIVLAGSAAWYRQHFSMSPARAFEVNSPGAGPKVLIATQGSAFKDAILAGIVAHLQPLPAYVKVIDVSALPGTNEAGWSAIVVIHTWEMRRPPPGVQRFLDRAADLHKVIVLGTSGAGTFKVEGVDAISTASVMTDAPARISQINSRLDRILSAPTNRQLRGEPGE